MNTIRCGLVLSGGGARGAYEAGVLAYIFKELPASLLAKRPFQFLCGTSVGAIHASFLASSAHLPNYNIDELLQVWSHFELQKLLRVQLFDILKLPYDLQAMLRGKTLPEGFILNVNLLQKIIMGRIEWSKIEKNITQGYLQGMTVSTTHILSGKTVVFVEQRGGGLPSWTRDRRRVAVATHIGPHHALASAAIPVIFPAIRIDGAYYCDGGLRQNTPISPALRLGADRVLVIAVGHGSREDRSIIPDPDANESFPGPALLVGKVMNALLLDHLDYDIAQMVGFNRLLQDGTAAFGETFLDELSKTATRIRGASYRKVDPMVIRPSQDMGQMAADYVMSKKFKMSGAGGWLLRQMSKEGALGQSDLLSYICFDSAFTKELIALGMQDADVARLDLIHFLSDETS